MLYYIIHSELNIIQFTMNCLSPKYNKYIRIYNLQIQYSIHQLVSCFVKPRNAEQMPWFSSQNSTGNGETRNELQFYDSICILDCPNCFTVIQFRKRVTIFNFVIGRMSFQEARIYHGLKFTWYHLTSSLAFYFGFVSRSFFQIFNQIINIFFKLKNLSITN